MKTVFLEYLPRKGKLINWKESIGYKVHFIYEDIEDDLKIVEYIKENQTLKLLYKNNEYKIKTGNFALCELGRIVNRYTNKYKISIGDIFKNEKRDINITNKNTELRNDKIQKLYKYKCNKCGFDCGKHWSIKNKCYKDELWVTESNIFKGDGCSCCSNQIVVRGINDIATANPKLVKYFVNIEDCYTHTYASNKKVVVKCPNCDSEKEMSINKLSLYGFSCNKCSDGISYPNKYMYNLLEQLDIEFKTEYSPIWCKYKINNINKKGRYDFYIPSKQLIIEMDGAFHYINNISGQTNEELKCIDNIKAELAIAHGIDIIRINCNYRDVSIRLAYIKESILNSKLNNIFDLSNIDWKNIDNYCKRSKIIQFSKLIELNYSKIDIMNKLNICQTTYYNYYNFVKDRKILQVV